MAPAKPNESSRASSRRPWNPDATREISSRCILPLTNGGVSLNIPAMHDENMAIVKGLIPVVWADGKFADKEREMIEALLEAFGASPEEVEQVRSYAETPRSIDDIPLTDLSFEDRRVLLQHAVFLSYVDGEQKQDERDLIDAMIKRLRIPEHEASALVAAATERAKRYLESLG